MTVMVPNDSRRAGHTAVRAIALAAWQRSRAAADPDPMADLKPPLPHPALAPLEDALAEEANNAPWRITLLD